MKNVRGKKASNVLWSIKMCRLKLNWGECNMFRTKIDIYRNTPMHQKLKAIRKTRQAENLEDKQWFSVISNYLGKLSLEFSKDCENCIKLIENEALWQIDQNHSNKISNFSSQMLVTKSAVSMFYNLYYQLKPLNWTKR